MKKIILIGLVLFVLSPIFLIAEDSEIFVKTMPITKIYTHRLGYKVIYLKTDLEFGEFYVPIKWFDQAGTRAILIKGHDAAYPFFSVFWMDGQFHSIKLYVKSNLQHETWGTLKPQSAQLAEFDIDEPVLEF